MKFDSNKIFILLAVFTLFVGISCISATDIDVNSTHIDDAIHSGTENVKINDTQNDFNAILDDNGNFVMTVPLTAGTGYHWEISSESYGVDLISSEFVEDHPGCCGSSGTDYFNFHANSGDYYVKLVLISPTGEIVKTVDSDMLN